MSSLPVSEAVKIRPVYRRYLHRKHCLPLYPPSEQEKADAIKVLQECYPPVWAIDELLLAEAERIFNEGGV
jgi:hypothetical protein